ncbi:transmembrane protein 179B [Austrofundulus limnaeus]|uniref:Transmembrane protein 179B n=1 Tax=Austrofundulus limnaeus TaxID=52670 RepID=A0A2I4C3G6_AUSLI|nr:PREDICTED: transmembrane protein 179B [Austrofundulus limnaeus]
MAVPPLLLLELAVYTSCFICGIVTAASLTVVQGHFGGQCMLYGQVSYNTTADTLGVSQSSSASLCYFVSAISIMVAVVCFSLVLYWVYTICMDGDVTRERMWTNLILLTSGVFLFFLLVTGCVLKVGRDSLCDSIKSTLKDIKSCDEAQNKKWAIPIQGDKFYSNLHKSETAVWVNFFLWLVIAVLVVVQQRRSSGSISTPAGALFGDSSTTASETEPFFNPPSRPH